jgi:hypothetical protein
LSRIDRYSRLDRLVHKLAFSGQRLQLALSEVEDKLYARELDKVTAASPVFITSLPRAGTTALLSALARLPGFASNTYRDMPFVMAPLLWSRLTGGFRRNAEQAERAHGDGMKIDFDSPEAFEEVIWKAFWKDHYRDDGITLWTQADEKPEATEFFLRHMRKIVALRGHASGAGRYLSKNNANIGRISLLRMMFPDAVIIVPVRHYLSQAASLLRQHRNFASLHDGTPFVRRYMEDIGHLEFGTLHRPLLFPGFSELSAGLPTDSLDYWIAYWIAAFRHVAVNRPEVIFISFEEFTAGDPAVIAQICRAVGADPALAPQLAQGFRPAPAIPQDALNNRGSLRDEAEALWQAIQDDKVSAFE